MADHRTEHSSDVTSSKADRQLLRLAALLTGLGHHVLVQPLNNVLKRSCGGAAAGVTMSAAVAVVAVRQCTVLSKAAACSRLKGKTGAAAEKMSALPEREVRQEHTCTAPAQRFQRQLQDRNTGRAQTAEQGAAAVA